MSRKMIPWLRALAALLEDQSLLPSIHIRELTTVYNSSTRRSGDFFRASEAPTYM